ncbi:endonuclease-reverse transcriptase [Elysia marginata]|uniref:Endonuclease-reverse transcriptase n=1 Tax=Elysia marginata TaxID=1093978 RepID=A0AAV4IVU8_9GAST|nr:endonuclease-reverse transcriptase [Elysia marginata]
MEKYLQRQHELHHGFIYIFKRHSSEYGIEALWSTMRQYNINSNLISVIENLKNKAIRAVICNDSNGTWFRTKVVVRQGCLLSSITFNIFLERIVTDALEDHFRAISIGG